jgi:hypothetical protein
MGKSCQNLAQQINQDTQTEGRKNEHDSHAMGGCVVLILVSTILNNLFIY